MNKQPSLPNIVILTGAGISAESGISTFRSEDGLWENHSVNDVATPEGFLRDPQGVQHFYNQLRRNLLAPEIKPNRAHVALAELERAFPENTVIITQNIDNLHERAGSKNVIHMHGELLKVRCQNTDKIYACLTDITPDTRCLCCDQSATLRPHIVWFGEMPIAMNKIERLLDQADYFIAIGTSGHVYPAAGFVRHANLMGAETVELNLEPSLVQNQFHERYYGLASEIVPEFITNLMKQIAE